MRGQRAASGYKEAASFRKIIKVAIHPAELQRKTHLLFNTLSLLGGDDWLVTDLHEYKS